MSFQQGACAWEKGRTGRKSRGRIAIFMGKIIGNHRKITYKCLFSLGNHREISYKCNFLSGNHRKIRAVNVKIGENHGGNGMFTKLELKHTFVDYTGM